MKTWTCARQLHSYVDHRHAAYSTSLHLDNLEIPWVVGKILKMCIVRTDVLISGSGGCIPLVIELRFGLIVPVETRALSIVVRVSDNEIERNRPFPGHNFVVAHISIYG